MYMKDRDGTGVNVDAVIQSDSQNIRGMFHFS